ncbi:hypothetical protein hrd7_01100 [Leptolinea sp. HRD-7]|nr:hypothetical protein hrd7_01100 [Leptolinea sp. HRD-7]
MISQLWKKRLFDWLAKPWVFPMLLAAVMVLVYGLQIGSLGFYWDDWEDIFLYHLNSPVEFLKYFLYDRPTTIWVYLVFFPLFGDNPILWQSFNLVLRYLSLLGLWWTFLQVWPRRRYEIGWLALLLAVFPAFFQQTIAVTYSRHFAALTLFSASLMLTVLSVRRRRWYVPLTLLAAVASFAQMMTIEYFVGLEIIRPYLLWVVFRDETPDRRKRFVRVIQWWLPYLFPLAGFIAWRFLIFKPVPGADDPNGVINLTLFKKDPAGMIVHLAQNILQDFLYLLIFAWSNTIQPGQIDLASKAAWFGWIMGAIAAVTAAVVLGSKESPTDNNADDRLFLIDWLLLGGLALMAGGLPVWITDRQIIVGQWSDRFSLGPMIGITMIVIILVSRLGYRRLQQSTILGLLLALSISSQIREVNRYRLNWDIQREYYWQFYWRVPGMKPGTALFGTKMPFGLIADYSVSYAINAIYAPDMDAKHLPYWFFSSMRAYGNDIPDFVSGLPVKYSIRNLNFTGSTSTGIVPNYKAGEACVRILKPEDEFSPFLSSMEAKLAKISNLDQILKENNDPRVTPAGIFGPEPEHEWCYYYQKADLAAQFEEWDTVVDLGNEAASKSFTPAVGMEYEPFIIGYACHGDWKTAYELTLKAAALTDNMEKSLCGDWARLEPAIQQGGTEAREISNKVKTGLQCQ